MGTATGITVEGACGFTRISPISQIRSVTRRGRRDAWRELESVVNNNCELLTRRESLVTIVERISVISRIRVNPHDPSTVMRLRPATYRANR